DVAQTEPNLGEQGRTGRDLQVRARLDVVAVPLEPAVEQATVDVVGRVGRIEIAERELHAAVLARDVEIDVGDRRGGEGGVETVAGEGVGAVRPRQIDAQLDRAGGIDAADRDLPGVGAAGVGAL